MTYKVGLTGGLASGKSRVAERLAARGIPVLDADRVVHDLYRAGGAGADVVAREFGASFLEASGNVDRKRLGDHVFADPVALARLNALVHPLVIDAQRAWFERLASEGRPLGVVEATLLVETGGAGGRSASGAPRTSDRRRRFDCIVAVSAPEEERLRRALARSPGADRAQLEERIRAQLPDAEREKSADIVIRNDGGLAALDTRADELAEELERRAAAR